MGRVTLILLTILLSFPGSWAGAVPIIGNSNPPEARKSGVQLPGNSGPTGAGAVDVSGSEVDELPPAMISKLAQEICDHRLGARNFINDPFGGTLGRFIRICENKLLNLSFKYSLSILLFLFSLQLYIKSSQFKQSANLNNFDIYNKIKNILVTPIIISFLFYMFFTFMINSMWSFTTNDINQTNNFLTGAVLFFISVNNTTCLLLLISSILLAFMAFWQLNLALPSGFERGEGIGRAFAFASPLLSIVASILTIIKFFEFA